ncbi:MAG: helix-turn-helix domain-containing protein, partial [Alphaproteobacteria bacterium]|nr:helix-turn-helix domain-containing protein [Alphaproteobacteria bacterium]
MTETHSDSEIRRKVGDILRDERILRDENLEDVAKALAIRLPFMEAIENSEPNNLPGAAYALGFVRTYADYLGLDSKSIVERYKEEAKELEKEIHLNFPEPLPSRGVPIGALLFIGTILAIVFYGTWWYLNNQDKSLADIIPNLSEENLEKIGDDLSSLTPPEPVQSPDAPSSESPTLEAVPEATPEAAPEAAPALETTVATVAEGISEAVEEPTSSEAASSLETTTQDIAQAATEVVEETVETTEAAIQEVTNQTSETTAQASVPDASSQVTNNETTQELASSTEEIAPNATANNTAPITAEEVSEDASTVIEQAAPSEAAEASGAAEEATQEAVPAIT